jgi:hypothetical protein
MGEYKEEQVSAKNPIISSSIHVRRRASSSSCMWSPDLDFVFDSSLLLYEESCEEDKTRRIPSFSCPIIIVLHILSFSFVLFALRKFSVFIVQV